MFLSFYVISYFYAAFASNPYVVLVLNGMQAGVAAVILDVVWGLGTKVVKSRSVVHILVMVGAFIATFFFQVNVIYIILTAAIAGVILVLVGRKETGV